MEGGEACVATASGMAAITSLCLALLQIWRSHCQFALYFRHDNHVVRESICRASVSIPVSLHKPIWKTGSGRSAPIPALLFVETPSNPLAEIADIAPAGRAGASVRLPAGSRQLFLYARAATPACAGSRSGDAFGDQVSGRAGAYCRRRRGGTQRIWLVRGRPVRSYSQYHWPDA